MSNGHPPLSGSSYIIICNGRIRVLNAGSSGDKIQEASDCATAFCSWLESNRTVNVEDFGEVSALQHEMMDNLKTYSKQEATTKANEMFDLLDELEDKYPAT